MSHKEMLLSAVKEECQKYLGKQEATQHLEIKDDFAAQVQQLSRDVQDLLILIKDEDWIDLSAISETAPQMPNTIDALLNPTRKPPADHFENLTLLVREVLKRANAETLDPKIETQNNPNEFKNRRQL